MGGAMENWGLIIYNENRLHEANDQYITHELGHQVNMCSILNVFSLKYETELFQLDPIY